MLDAQSGNLTTQPNQIASWTNDPLVSPVEPSELAEYLSVEVTDPLLPGLLLAATEAVSNYTNVELVKRDWFWRADRYPERQPSYLGLGPSPAAARWWITLPKWPLITVEDATAESFEYDAHTSRVYVHRPTYPLTIEYVAGYDDVPEIFKQAIMAVAAYMYEHRGECEAGDAVKLSGAGALLGGRKRYVGGL